MNRELDQAPSSCGRPHRSALLADPDALGAAVAGAPDQHVSQVPVQAAVTRIVQTLLEQHRFHGQVATRLGDGRRTPLAAGLDRYPFTCDIADERAEE